MKRIITAESSSPPVYMPMILGVKSALVRLRLVYYLTGLLLRRTRYASGRQLRCEYVTDTLRVVGGQLAAYLRTCLQDVALVGVQNVNKTILLHLPRP